MNNEQIYILHKSPGVKFNLEPSFVSYELRNHDFLSCHRRSVDVAVAVATVRTWAD